MRKPVIIIKYVIVRCFKCKPVKYDQLDAQTPTRMTYVGYGHGSISCYHAECPQFYYLDHQI